MTPLSPEDRQLREAFGALEPDLDRVARLEERILADYITDRRSLAAEWLDLLRLGPVQHAGYAVAAAAGLAVTTPIGTLLYAAMLL